MGQSVKGKFTLKQRETHKSSSDSRFLLIWDAFSFSANQSIGMQTRNKLITHDDQLWIRPSFLRIQLTGTSAYTRLTEDLLNIRVIEWCRGRLNEIGNLCYFSKCGLSVSDTFKLCWFFGWASLHTSSLLVRGFEDLSSGIRESLPFSLPM